MAIKTNSKWRLVNDFGVGPGFIPAGSELVVSGVHPPGTAGIGYVDEDTVVAHYDRPEAAPQTVALPASLFTTMVKAAG